MPITPHIVVQGAERAAAFYRDAFGAEELEPDPDARRAADVGAAAHRRTASCTSPTSSRRWACSRPPSIGGTAVVLALEVADAEAVFAQAVAAGAAGAPAAADTFWGDRHGQLDDPFGHRWNVAQHLRDVPHDEVVAAAARAFG